MIEDFQAGDLAASLTPYLSSVCQDGYDSSFVDSDFGFQRDTFVDPDVVDCIKSAGRFPDPGC